MTIQKYTLIKQIVIPKTFTFTPIPPELVKEELHNLDQKKAKSLNYIPPKHLIECADECGSVLINLINSCIFEKYFLFN